MTKRASSKPASSPTPNTARCSAHDAARQLQMRKALPRGGLRRRKHVGKGLADHAEHGRHLRDVRNPFRTQAVAGEQHQRGQAIQHPGQPLPLHVGIDHHEAEMGDLLALAVELDVHHRQRVEGDRPAGRLLGDQRDDGARQTFALAGEDAVGEAAGRQRLAGDDAQTATTSSSRSGCDSDRPGLSTIRVCRPAWVRKVRSMVACENAFSQNAA